MIEIGDTLLVRLRKGHRGSPWLVRRYNGMWGIYRKAFDYQRDMFGPHPVDLEEYVLYWPSKDIRQAWKSVRELNKNVLSS